MGFPDVPGGKESACSAGYPGSIPGLGRSPGEGGSALKCNPLQYSCLGNSLDRGARRATVHGVPKSGIRQRLTHTCLAPATPALGVCIPWAGADCSGPEAQLQLLFVGRAVGALAVGCRRPRAMQLGGAGATVPGLLMRSCCVNTTPKLGPTQAFLIPPLP